MYQADFSDSKLRFKQTIQSFEEVSFEDKRFFKTIRQWNKVGEWRLSEPVCRLNLAILNKH